MKTIEEIEVRAEEIRDLMTAEDADLTALQAEAESLVERKKEIIAEQAAKKEERRAAIDAVISGAGKEIEKKEERTTMDIKELRNSNEYIEAYAKYVKSGKDAECRALLSTNATGEGITGYVPVPDIVMDRIRTAWEADDITSRFTRTFLRGNVKVGYEVSATDAEVHAEGTDAPNEETLILGVVQLVPQNIKKWITVSHEALELSASDFLAYIYDEIAYKIAKKAADIAIAKITAAAAPFAATVSAAPGLTTITSAYAALGDEARDPVVIMNKQTYVAFKEVAAAASYPIDPFEGMRVLYNNTLPVYSAAAADAVYAIVGDLRGVQANFPAGEDIKFVFDPFSLAEEDLVKIVGRQFVAIEVVQPGGFALVTKPA